MATPADDDVGPRLLIRDRESSQAVFQRGRWTGATELIVRMPEDGDDEPADPVILEA